MYLSAYISISIFVFVSPSVWGDSICNYNPQTLVCGRTKKKEIK